MLLLILSSYRISDTESTETIPYPMDDNPGRESASASSRMGTPGSVRSRSHSPMHSPPNHRRRCRRRRGGRGQGGYIGRGCCGVGPRRPWCDDSGPICGRGGRGSWRPRRGGGPWGGSGPGPRRGGGHGVSGGSLSGRQIWGSGRGARGRGTLGRGTLEEKHGEEEHGEEEEVKHGEEEGLKASGVEECKFIHCVV